MLGVLPSYSTGFAHSKGESEYPELWDGLVSAWFPVLGITGNKVFDLSGNVREGTFVNSPTWISGPFGSAIDFVQASGQYIQFGQNVNPTSDKVSVVVGWTPGITSRSDVIGQWAGVDSHCLISAGLTANKFVFYIRTSSYQNSGNSSMSFTVGRSYQIAGTYDRQNIVLYVDGVQENSAAHTEALNHPANDWRIGGSYDDNGEGQAHYAYVYNRSLSVSEIALLNREPTALVQLRRWLLVRAPVGITNVTVTPSTLALTASIQAVTVDPSLTILPSALSITATAQSVAVDPSLTITPSALGLTASVQAPTVDPSLTVSPSVIALTGTVQTPTIDPLLTITPSALALTATLNAPTVDPSLTVSPSTLAVTATLNTPSITLDWTVTPASIDLTASVQSPNIDTGVAVCIAAIFLMANRR